MRFFLATVFSPQDLRDIFLKNRDPVGDYLPDDLKIDVKVTVGNNILQPGHLFPRDGRVAGFPSSGRFFIASPITSKFLITASWVR